jgi:hypothetical protein
MATTTLRRTKQCVQFAQEDISVQIKLRSHRFAQKELFQDLAEPSALNAPWVTSVGKGAPNPSFAIKMRKDVDSPPMKVAEECWLPVAQVDNTGMELILAILVLKDTLVQEELTIQFNVDQAHIQALVLLLALVVLQVKFVQQSEIQIGTLVKQECTLTPLQESGCVDHAQKARFVTEFQKPLVLINQITLLEESSVAVSHAQLVKNAIFTLTLIVLKDFTMNLALRSVLSAQLVISVRITRKQHVWLENTCLLKDSLSVLTAQSSQNVLEQQIQITVYAQQTQLMLPQDLLHAPLVK